MQGEAFFVLDDGQRIVEWSEAAASALGIPEKQALGRHCFEILQGRDFFGRTVCQQECHAFKSLEDGRVTARCTLLLNKESNHDRQVDETLVALPQPLGGYLVTLTEHQQTSKSPQPTSAITTVRDLVELTTLASALSGGPLNQSIDETLDWLRQVLDVEVAELFVAEPHGEGMLLTASSGPFKSAFSEITRFASGEGFPGLILTNGRPIATRKLLEEPRYLRTRVKEKGFQSYVCVPVLGQDGVIGVLNVADRRPDLDTDRASRVLTWAGRLVSTVLHAGILENRIAVMSQSADASENATSDVNDRLHGVLQQMMAIGAAAGGSLSLLDESGRNLLRRVSKGEFDGSLCSHPETGEAGLCPALIDNLGLILRGPKSHRPPACQRLNVGDGVIYCLPLVIGKEAVGIVQLKYPGHGPEPATKYLPFLLDASIEAAKAVRRVRMDMEEQERKSVMLRQWKSQLDEESTRSNGSPVRLPHQIHSTDTNSEHPAIDIRLLGPFEIYQNGHLVLPDSFSRRGALTALKILMLHEGRPVARDRLAELLWPNTDPHAASNRVHGIIHALRSGLEPKQHERSWAFILSEGDRYYFNTDASYRFDAKEFREYVALGERLERDAQAISAIDSYEAAVNLYKGDLLQDDPYAEWCWYERESLRETYLDVAKKLAVLHLSHDAPLKSIEIYRRALKADPL